MKPFRATFPHTGGAHITSGLLLLLICCCCCSSVRAQEIEDGPPPTQAFDMHNCPPGYALRGVHVGQNRFLCRRVQQVSEDCFVDYGTQRNGMHSCPDGTYMRGLRVDRNQLTCCYDRERGFTEFSGAEFLDTGSQDHGMHVCQGANRNAYMTGIHVGLNQFLCRSVPATPSPIPNPVRINLDPQHPRFFFNFNSSVSLDTWQRATRNWLFRILNVPVNQSYLTPPAFTVLSRTTVEGVEQQLIQYPSPVDGRPSYAYLTFPPGYRPGGSYAAVLVTHGHDPEAKDGTGRDWNDAHHAAALYLAQYGAITLAPDTRSFGQYSVGTDHDSYTNASMPGAIPQQYILDNLVRVSILSHVPGVDPNRIYSAGLSLGGYQAMWIAAMDPRIKKAVVAGLFLDLACLDSSAMHHACQTVPSLSLDYETASNPRSTTISQGSLLINTSDLAALIAPRPLLATWGTSDPFFNSQASCVASARTGAQQVYQSLGIASLFQVTEVPGMEHELEDATTAAFLLGGVPTVQRDYGNQCFGMHCCPPGQAMVGVRLDRNQFLCRPVIPAANETCSVDPRPGGALTQRNDMHACPLGTYMRGLHVGNNQLTCCYDRTVGPQPRAETVDSGTQLEGMHGCPGNPPQLMTGIRVDRNQLLCSPH